MGKSCVYSAGTVLICSTIFFLPGLHFIKGEYTNYSMGQSVYICFSSVAVYCILTVVLIIVQHRNIPKKIGQNLVTPLVCIILILTLQIIFPELLITCIADTMAIISIYLNMENPAIRGLKHYHNEMVMGNAGVREYWIVAPLRQIVTVNYFEGNMFTIQHSFNSIIRVNIYGDLLIDFSEIADMLNT